jgi:GNAT superfamily N-acetyltransferase
MVRWNMDDLAAFPLPAHFGFKWYAPGDEDHWYRIHLRADRFNSITPELFAEQFGSESRMLQERQCYLIAPNHEIIGTATAWYNDDFLGKKFGRVHWLAIDPAYQGQGLSRPLLSAICQKLRALGHNCAYLSTSPERLPAIRLYRRFGFQPLIQSEHDAALWRVVEQNLQRHIATGGG